MEAKSYQTTGSTRALWSENTIDVDSTSMIECALLCLSNQQCCFASFCTNTSTCRIDTSETCCINTENVDGWRTIRRNIYLPITSTRSISIGNSMYAIIEEGATWQKANESCKCLGGKLLELETSEENEFIKDEVRTLNTGVEGYWVGGYNFNHDHDMEWLSKPNQLMPFSNMESGEPNYPAFQPCMMIFRDFDFRWGDHYCSSQLSYICEFQYQ
ncbi:unnamed protein product [Mytilus edulis]|uniref:C-type lectin domain-containing protein n=1 Tax=Mytilus edulis TaxID=6550 RepID=A0A8S3T537_MYTED|nr:unnamed protein product [Mytilus edulis]